MDFLEAQNFQGSKVSFDQAVQWPRYGVTVDFFWIDSDEIPQLLKDAQAEAALAVDRGISQIADVTRPIDSVTADTVTVEFSKNGQSTTINRALQVKLRKLLASSSNGISFSVNRG